MLPVYGPGVLGSKDRIARRRRVRQQASLVSEKWWIVQLLIDLAEEP